MFGKGFPFLNSAGGFYPRGNLSFPLQVTGVSFRIIVLGVKEEGGPCLWFAIFIHRVGFIERRLDPLICLRYSFPPQCPLRFSGFPCTKLTNCLVYTEAIESRRPGGYTSKVRVRDRYHIVGFISSGTYGRVYKAIGKNGQKGEFAIKKYVSSLDL